MQVHLQRTFASPGQRRSLIQGQLTQGEVLHRLTLPVRQLRHCGCELPVAVASFQSIAWASSRVGVSFVGERIVNLMRGGF